MEEQTINETSVVTESGDNSTRVRRFMGQPYKVGRASINLINYKINWDEMAIRIIIQRIASVDAMHLEVSLHPNEENYLNGKPRKPEFSFRERGITSISFEEMIFITEDMKALFNLLNSNLTRLADIVNSDACGVELIK